MKPLDQHVAKVRKSRQKVDAALASLDAARDYTEQVRAIVREILLDHLCLCQKSLPTMEDLHKASAIVARVVSSALEARKLDNHSATTVPPPATVGLGPELCEDLQRDLDLM
jgi:hypothetical protein